MNFLKFLPHAMIIGVLAAGVMFVEAAYPTLVPSFLVFQTWAIYFLAGCEVKTGIKGGACYILGLVASMVIIELAGVFGGMGMANFALPTSVAIIATLIILMEKVKPLDFIPGYFVASGGGFFAFFNVMGYGAQLKAGTFDKIAGYSNVFTVTLTCLAFGLFMGWLTVTLRNAYQNLLDRTGEATTEEKK